MNPNRPGGAAPSSQAQAPVPTPPAIAVNALVKTYHVGTETLTVLHGLNFSVATGEVVAVTGESGSGKSTLLHLLGSLDTPTSGTVRVAGKDPFSGGDLAVSRFRNQHIGFVFQHNNLLPEFDALENVVMPALIAGTKRNKALAFARELLVRVGLGHRLSHFPSQLSGGEQQRVAIARALVNRPTLLLADEPSGNLDSRNAERIHQLFLEVNHYLGTTVLVVTHNAAFAAALPRRIELRDGEILSDSGAALNMSCATTTQADLQNHV